MGFCGLTTLNPKPKLTTMIFGLIICRGQVWKLMMAHRFRVLGLCSGVSGFGLLGFRG